MDKPKETKGRLRAVADFLRRGLTKLPIFGRLYTASPKAHHKAFKEVGISAVLSTLPIWLGGLLGGLIALGRGNEGFFTAAFLNMQSYTTAGELYMLSAATLAPVFYIGSGMQSTSGRDIEGEGAGPLEQQRPFPTRDIHRFFIALFLSVDAVIFFVMRMEGLIDRFTIVTLSIIFYLMSLLMIYAASVYYEDRMTYVPFEQAASEEAKFGADYQQHRDKS